MWVTIYGDLLLFHGARRAAWVLGWRLISSARTTWAITGPGEFDWRRLVKNRNAGHIAGQHIRRKLDAAERAAQRARQAARQHGFAHAWHIFDQQVALANKPTTAQL
jgi:hypothetical protein